MLDRRRTPRLPTVRSVRIDMNPRWPTIDCAVRNISSQGAGIEISDGFNTPLEFDLIFPTSNQKRRCRQMWRQENRLGVAFC